jgi:hypothetical protein
MPAKFEKIILDYPDGKIIPTPAQFFKQLDASVNGYNRKTLMRQREAMHSEAGSEIDRYASVWR